MKYEKDYFGFVYLWYDRKRKWFCLGSHFGSLDDGYSSSTGFFDKALAKRRQDMTRRILYFEESNDHSALLEAEQKWLDLIKHEELDLETNRHNKTVRYYNRKRNSQGIDSKVAKILADKRVAEGTHHFLGGEFHRERIKKGVWHTLGPEMNKKRVENGTHNFLNDKRTSKVGEKNGRAKLTEAIVREIKKSDEPQKILADRFGIDRSVISCIRSGKSWSHVQ